MKVFVALSTILAAASAAPQLLASHGVIGHAVAHPVVHAVAHPVVHAVAHPVVHAAGYAAPDLAEPSPYTYNYAVADDYSKAAFTQSESNDGTGAVSGSYSVNLPDGRIQTVTYNANDLTGNVAEVTYSGEAVYPPAPAGGYVAAAPVVRVAHPVVHAVAHPVLAHAVSPVVGHAVLAGRR